MHGFQDLQDLLAPIANDQISFGLMQPNPYHDTGILNSQATCNIGSKDRDTETSHNMNEIHASREFPCNQKEPSMSTFMRIQASPNAHQFCKIQKLNLIYQNEILLHQQHQAETVKKVDIGQSE